MRWSPGDTNEDSASELHRMTSAMDLVSSTLISNVLNVILIKKNRYKHAQRATDRKGETESSLAQVIISNFFQNQRRNILEN